jgi:hypothetical protein
MGNETQEPARPTAALLAAARAYRKAVAAAATPGQAAHDAWCADDDWDELSDDERDLWEASAWAGHERIVAGLVWGPDVSPVQPQPERDRARAQAEAAVRAYLPPRPTQPEDWRQNGSWPAVYG